MNRALAKLMISSATTSHQDVNYLRAHTSSRWCSTLQGLLVEAEMDPGGVYASAKQPTICKGSQCSVIELEVPHGAASRVAKIHKGRSREVHREEGTKNQQ